MSVVARALCEIIGLFADDAGYAAAILGWVAICAAAAPLGEIRWAALPVGLGAILLLSVRQATLRRR